MKEIRAKTATELLAKIYKIHGWKRAEGESRSKRVTDLYDIFVDHKKDRFVAKPK
jgi:hypothetical protein